MKIRKVCPICKVEFFVYPSQSNKIRCSTKCYAKSKIGITPWNKGLKGKYHTGFSYWYGKSLTEETKKKMSDTHIKNKTNWKGDEVGYYGIHKWIIKVMGVANNCELCGGIKSNKFHWSNKDHLYKRNVDDWWMLCCSCHKKYDIDFLGVNTKHKCKKISYEPQTKDRLHPERIQKDP